MFRIIRRRPVLVASVVTPVAVAALVTELNDEWDSVIPSSIQKRWKSGVFPKEDKAPRSQPREKLLILGTGWGALECLRKARQGNFDVTVVSPRPFFLYTPLLAGATVGTVHHGNIIEPIRDVLGGKEDASFVQATALSVDLERRVVVCELPEEYEDAQVSSLHSASSSVTPGPSQAELPFDKLVIAVGARPATFGIPGVEEHAFFLKELDHSAVLQQRILNCLERASALQTLGAQASSKGSPDGVNPNDEAVEKLLHFVIVGGGPTGVELSAELSDFVRSDVARLFPTLAPKVRITLLEAAPRILGPFQETLAEHARDHLESQGVRVRCSTGVTAVLGPHRAKVKSTARAGARGASQGGNGGKEKADAGVAGGEEVVHFGALVWAAGIATRSLVCDLATRLGPEAGQTMPRRGLAVDSSLRVKGVPGGHVFALGDCALSGLPPTAQVASQQGKWLGRLLGGSDGASSLASLEADAPTVKTSATGGEGTNDSAPSPASSAGSASAPLKTTTTTTTTATTTASAQVSPQAAAAAAAPPTFQYEDKGKMAYIGSHKAIVVTKPPLGEPPLQRLRDHVWWRSLHGADTTAQAQRPEAAAPPPSHEKGKYEREERALTGGAAFAFWRGVYFSKLLSGSNRVAVAMDWIQAEVFGRDVTVHQAQMKRHVTRVARPTTK